MRSTIAIVLAMLVILASCGTSDDPEEQAIPTTTTLAEPTDTEPQGADPAADAGTDDSADTGAFDGEGESTTEADQPTETTRVVEHQAGTTEVPIEPQRVYIGGPDALDVAIALDVPVVGGAFWRDDLQLPPYLAAVAGDVPTPTSTDEPNLELVAALQPDLIVLPAGPDTRLYELFEQIAPTVVFGAVDQGTFERESWDELVTEIASYVNREDRVDEVLATYEANIERLLATLEETGFAGREVVVMRPTGLTDFRIYRPIGQSAGDTIWEDADLPYQEIPDTLVDNGVWAGVSAERVDLVTAELVFIVLPEGFREIAEVQLEENLVWSASPAINNGQICLIDRPGSEQAWFNVGPLATAHIIDDIVDCLSG